MCRCAISWPNWSPSAPGNIGEIDFTFNAERVARSYGDSIDLTMYRCIQEGMTNAIRHAQASRIEVVLTERAGGAGHSEDGPAQLNLTIRDDGCGIAPGTPMGYGMRGMQERVQGLGGSYAVKSHDGQGTSGRNRDPVARRGQERLAVHLARYLR